VQPGDILAGKYTVERVLGVGGMGVVVRAMHMDLHQRVAVKFMLPRVAEQPESVIRFLREARAAARLHSDHVARVRDVGRLQTGEPYMVMEYLEGSDLASVLARDGPLPVTDAVDWLLQACEAIAEAHAAGIVHRDLKPSNLFLTRSPDGTPFVKVLDFGISKLLKPVTVREPNSSITSSFAILGSPAYMSPEQLRSSKKVDHRSDIWSIGIILFELLTGEHAFRCDSLPGLILAIGSAPAPSVRRLRQEVPVEMDRLVQRLLEKRPEQRFPDLAEVALELAPFGSDEARASSRRIVRVLRTAGPPHSHGSPAFSSLPDAFGATVDMNDEDLSVRAGSDRTGSPMKLTSRVRPQRGMLFAAAGVVVVVGVAAGVTARLTHRHRTGGPTETPAQGSAAVPGLPEPSFVRRFEAPDAPSFFSDANTAPATLASGRPIRGALPLLDAAAARTGLLNIVCVPACNDVSVDGSSLGPSPVVLASVSVGVRRVVAVLPSGESQAIHLTIQEGMTTSRRIVFDVTEEVTTDNHNPWDEPNPYTIPATSAPPPTPTPPPHSTGDGFELPDLP
jgi:serine/threonine-protein kinase